ncbi:MAG: type 4a pilus biogenesis protein PilO [Candidatus Methylomirabilales bacterium]
MKHRLLFLALFLLLLNLAFFFLVILPARRALVVHAATLQDLQAQIRSLRHERRQQEVLDSVLKGVQQFRNRIPPQGTILSMIRRVTDQAQRLDLDVPSVNYQPAKVTEEELVKLTVQMEVEGSYGGVRRFLYEVEGLQDPLVIEKVVLTSRRGTDRLSLRLQMAAYFLVETDSGRVNRPATEDPLQEKEPGAQG